MQPSAQRPRAEESDIAEQHDRGLDVPPTPRVAITHVAINVIAARGISTTPMLWSGAWIPPPMPEGPDERQRIEDVRPDDIAGSDAVATPVLPRS